MMCANHRHFLFPAWLIFIASILLSASIVSADSGLLRSQWQQGLRSTYQLQQELLKALEQMETENRLMQMQLRDEAAQLESIQPSASALRDARLAFETQSAWAQTLESRASYRQREINALKQSLGNDENPLLERLIAQKKELLETLKAFNKARHMRVYLAAERLAQLQSRIDLWGADLRAETEDDPRISLIERVIAGLIRTSFRLTNKATELAAKDPQNIVARNRLEFEADDAAVRATLRQADMDSLRLDQWLDLVDSMLEDETMPVSNLLQARDALELTVRQLNAKRGSLGKRQAILETQKSINRIRKSASQNQFISGNEDLLSSLESLVNFQKLDLEKRLWRIRTAQKTVNESMEKAYAHSLLVRQALPQSGQDWLRVTDSLISTPSRLVNGLDTAGRYLISRLNAVSISNWIRLLGIAMMLVIAAAGIKLWLRWLLPAEPVRLWQSVADAAAAAVGWLVPIGIWLAGVKLFMLSTQIGQSGLLLLLIWPSYQISRGYLQHFYRTRANNGDTGHSARLCSLLRRIKVIAILGMIFMALSHWSHSIPTASYVFERIFMLCLLLVVVMGFQARFASLSAHSGPETKRGIRILQFMGGVVGIAALAGVLGYSSFAWLGLFHLYWLTAFATFMWLMISVVRASTDRLNRIFRRRELNSGAMWLFSVLHPLSWIVMFVLAVALLYLLLAVFTWGATSPLLIWVRDASGLNSLQVGTFLLSDAGRRFSSSVIDITIAMLLAYVLWELVKRSLQKYMPEESDSSEIGGEGGGTGASRISTLMPLLRKLIFITIVVITVMVILSALGVNIGPLLAGAGVVGIAVGFGAQALVKDIISGVFFLMDDAFRMGEYVDIGGDIKGTVERISVRSLQLRHHNGPVHTIPFGEIQYLTNYSRDWAIMKFEFRIGFETDIDVVRRIIKKVGAALMEDEEFGPLLLEPLKSQGVNRMDDSALIIRCKFTAVPGQQFYVRRQAFTLIQRAFEEKGIKFAPKRVIVESASSEDAAQEAAAAAATDDAARENSGK